MNKLYTAKEFAEKVGVTPATVVTWVREGKVKPAGKTGKWNLFSLEQVDYCRGLISVRFESAAKLAAIIGVSEKDLVERVKPDYYSPDGVAMYRHRYPKDIAEMKELF